MQMSKYCQNFLCKALKEKNKLSQSRLGAAAIYDGLHSLLYCRRGLGQGFRRWASLFTGCVSHICFVTCKGKMIVLTLHYCEKALSRVPGTQNSVNLLLYFMLLPLELFLIFSNLTNIVIYVLYQLEHSISETNILYPYPDPSLFSS